MEMMLGWLIVLIISCVVVYGVRAKTASDRPAECPLSGVKRTLLRHATMPASDPKRTLPTHRRSAVTWWRTTGFFYPCFAMRLGGVSGGKDIQGWRDSSHTPMVGAGKFGSAKVPMATATYPGKPSPSQ